MRLILDPEENDYLLPNDAVIGFYLSIDNSVDKVLTSLKDRKQYERSIDILRPPPEGDEVFVGSQFQTIIQIGFIESVRFVGRLLSKNKFKN